MFRRREKLTIAAIVTRFDSEINGFVGMLASTMIGLIVSQKMSFMFNPPLKYSVNEPAVLN